MKKNSKSKIDRIYSTALYEAAESSGNLDEVLDDTLRLRELLAQDKDLYSYLASPLWEDRDKADILKKTAAVLKLNEETEKCLEIIVENRRSCDLPAILSDFADFYYDRKGIAKVEVETARALSPSQDKRLQAVLKKILIQPVKVEYCINSAVLGGLRVRYGSKMFDDTLSTKLNYLEQVMKGK